MNGDVSEKDKQLALQLIEYEKEIDVMEDFSNDRKAQQCVCLAHDWYQIGMEEEAHRLLLKAEVLFPGYFRNKMLQHIMESEDFSKLVKSLTLQMLWTVSNQVGDKK